MLALSGVLGTVRHRLMIALDGFSAADRVFLTRVLTVAEKAHEGQFRKPGRDRDSRSLPYIIHPMRSALIIIEELGLKDRETIATAMLHDVIEDSGSQITIRDIERKFGRLIAFMVSILSKPPKDEKMPRQRQLTVYYERLAAASIETRIVKLADRLDNLRDAIECGDREFQKRYLEETRRILIPIAENTDAYLHDELVMACASLEHVLAA